MKVAALYVRADSVYKILPGVDPWDKGRDASRYAGPWPVICHPPCRSWGRFAYKSKGSAEEKALAVRAILQAREFGGVVEHPEASGLWLAAGCPEPGGGRDDAGGWCLTLNQGWFGHPAQKRTRLYVVGASPRALPAFPISLQPASRTVEGMSKAQRERTPPDFAEWLVKLAALCAPEL